jgi:hypothetical protein
MRNGTVCQPAVAQQRHTKEAFHLLSLVPCRHDNFQCRVLVEMDET